MARPQHRYTLEGKSNLKREASPIVYLSHEKKSTLTCGSTRGTVTNERPTVAIPVIVHDISGEEDKYSLSSHGFQLIPHETLEEGFWDDDRIKAKYFPECEKLIRDL